DSAAIGAPCVLEELGSRTSDDVDLVLGQAPSATATGGVDRLPERRRAPRRRPGALPPAACAGAGRRPLDPESWAATRRRPRHTSVPDPPRAGTRAPHPSRRTGVPSSPNAGYNPLPAAPRRVLCSPS